MITSVNCHRVSYKNLVTKQSARPFRFGDGKVVHSTRKVIVPAMLLCKTSLKRASAVLNIAHDKATMFEQPVKLELTSSGHYCVSLRDDSDAKESETQTLDEDEVLTVTENMTTKEKKDGPGETA